MLEFLLCRAYQLFLGVRDTSSRASEIDVMKLNVIGANQVCSSTGTHELYTCTKESKQGCLSGCNNDRVTREG